MKRNSILYFFAGLAALLPGILLIYQLFIRLKYGYGIFSPIDGLVIPLVLVGGGLLYFGFFFGKFEPNKLARISAITANVLVISIALILSYGLLNQGAFGDGGYGLIPFIFGWVAMGLYSLVTIYIATVQAVKQRKLKQQGFNN